MVENDIIWGGSGIEKVTYEFIKDRVPLNSTVVEFGGGDCSTRALGSIYNLYTVEHNPGWVGRYNELTEYIYAPLEDGWYKIKPLKEGLPEKIDFLFIDGPSGGGVWMRDGMLKNLDILNLEKTIIIIHDTFRSKDEKFAKDLAKQLNKEVKFYEEGSPKDYWALIQ